MNRHKPRIPQASAVGVCQHDFNMTVDFKESDDKEWKKSMNWSRARSAEARISSSYKDTDFLICPMLCAESAAPRRGVASTQLKQ